MQLVQLIIPAEAAHDTVYQLGEVRSACCACATPRDARQRAPPARARRGAHVRVRARSHGCA
jgi:hypothetical protein